MQYILTICYLYVLILSDEFVIIYVYYYRILISYINYHLIIFTLRISGKPFVLTSNLNHCKCERPHIHANKSLFYLPFISLAARCILYVSMCVFLSITRTSSCKLLCNYNIKSDSLEPNAFTVFHRPLVLL